MRADETIGIRYRYLHRSWMDEIRIAPLEGREFLCEHPVRVLPHVHYHTRILLNTLVVSR
jgi:hypothetical protein